MKKLLLIIKYILLILIILIFLILGSIYGIYWNFKSEVPSAVVLEEGGFRPALHSKVFAKTGELIGEFYIENRILIPLDSIPEKIIQAFIAVEDQAFYSHWGLNIKRIFAAALANIKAEGIVQGGSTITQQLARTLFLKKEPTIIRKIKEAILAIDIERRFSKEEILYFYLNSVYFGEGAYGVQAAAQTYFGKDIRDCSLGEISLLVGLVRLPAKYSPRTDLEKTLRRRALVLKAMYEMNFITKNEMEEALREPVNLAPKKLPVFKAPYFTEEVRRWLIETFGPDLVYKEGISVYTTLDYRLQEIAEKAVENGLAKLEENYFFPYPYKKYKGMKQEELDVIKYLQGALVAIDPHSGKVLAMVGGRDFSQSQFNRATQALRQPGSAFKVFVYTAAIDNNIPPSELLLDAPIVTEAGGEIYKPENYDGKFHGFTTMQEALHFSYNLCAVRTIMRIGPYTVQEYAKRMGIRSKIRPFISLALGACEVNLLELTSAYSTLPNQGIWVRPYLVEKIVDRDNKEIWVNVDYREEAISPQTAYVVTHMMMGVMDYGTGLPARASGFKLTSAGKTGTTNEYTDAWFIGFTPDLICGVWVGFDDHRRIGKGMTGSRVAVPVWTNFMLDALDQNINKSFPVPSGVVSRPVCLESGELATSNCPNSIIMAFIAGTQPQKSCHIHKEIYDYLADLSNENIGKPTYDAFLQLNKKRKRSLKKIKKAL